MSVDGGSAKATHAGTYLVTATLDSTDNVAWADGTTAPKTIPATIAQATNVWESDPTVPDVTFGEALAPAGQAKFSATGEPAVTYATSPTGGYAATAPTDAGTYYALFAAAATDDYTELLSTCSFSINQKLVTEDMIDAIADQVYTGSPIEPAVTVRNGDATLAKGTDFTLAFESNTSKGTAYAVVTGTGNYAGTARKAFTIDYATVAVPANMSLTYNGGAQYFAGPTAAYTYEVTTTSAVDGYGVSESRDTYGYAYATHAATYTVKVTLNGNYKWKDVEGDAALAPKTFTVTVSPLSVADATFSDIADQTYTGAAIEPAFSVSLDIDGDLKPDPLYETRNYTYAYADNVNAGQARVTITGVGDFTGTATKAFTIKPADVTISVAVASDKTDTISYGDTYNRDNYTYTVSGLGSGSLGTIAIQTAQQLDGYAASGGRIVAGEYPVGVTYTESPNYNVTVSPAKLLVKPKELAATVQPAQKTFGEADPTFTGVTWTSGSVYSGDELGLTISRTGTDENAGTYAGVLMATYDNPNYAVTFTPGTFTINSRTIADATVTMPTEKSDGAYVYSFNGTALAPTPNSATVTLESPAVRGDLFQDTDFTLTYLNSSGATVSNLAASGTYTMRLTGMGNYRSNTYVDVPIRLTPAEHAVTFAANGGSWDDTATSKPTTQGYGETYKLPTVNMGGTPTVADPKRPGYTFQGWYTKSGDGGDWGDCVIGVDASGKSLTNVTCGLTADATLFAKWQINQYTATFDAGTGGTLSGGGVLDANNKVTVDFATTVPAGVSASHDGLTFQGWSYDYVAADGVRRAGVAADYATLPIEGDVTLTATYVEPTFFSAAAQNGKVTLGYDTDPAAAATVTVASDATGSASYTRMQDDTAAYPNGVVGASLAYAPANENFGLVSIGVRDLAGATATLDASAISDTGAGTVTLSGVTYGITWVRTNANAGTIKVNSAAGTATSLAFSLVYTTIQSGYEVEHWKQSPDGAPTYNLAESYSFEAESGDPIDYEAKSYPGYQDPEVRIYSSVADPDASGAVRNDRSTVVELKYELEKYDATWQWLDVAGTTRTGSVYFGTTPAYPEEAAPTKATDLKYSYTFDHWEDESGNRLTADYKAYDGVTMHALYTETPVPYDVTLRPNGGTQAAGQADHVSVGYSTTATLKDPTSANGWTFAGWHAEKSNPAAPGEVGTVVRNADGTSTYTGGTAAATLSATWRVPVPACLAGLAYTGEAVHGIAAAAGFTLSGVTPKAGTTAKADGATVSQGDAVALHAGTYTATATLSDAGAPGTDVALLAWADGTTDARTVEFEIARAQNSWKVAPAMPELIVYGSPYEPAAGEATYQAASGEPVFTYASSADGPFGATKPQQKGTWYMRAAVAQADDYEALVSAPVAFEIKPATLDNANVTLSEATYTGAAQEPAATVQIGSQAPLNEGVDYVREYYRDESCSEASKVEASDLVNAGTYYVKVIGKGNYAGSFTTKPYTIERAPLTLRAGSIQLTGRDYDGTTVLDKSLVGTSGVEFGGAQAGETPTIDAGALVATLASADAADGVAVGVTGITLANDAAGANVNRNYTIATVDGGALGQVQYAGTVDVAKRPLTISGVPAADKVYDGSTAATLDVSTPSIANAAAGETPTLDVRGATGSFADANVGAGKAVSVTGIALGTDAVNRNYVIAEKDGAQISVTASITKRPVTITCTAAEKTYGDADPTLTGTVEGVVTGESLNVTYARTTGDAAGTYQISASWDTANGNYEVTHTPATFTIKKKAATVTCDAASKTYGEADPVLGGTVTGLANGDTADKMAFTRVPGEDAGTYQISATWTAGDNYDWTMTPATFTIGKRPLSVLADAKSAIYGKLPELSTLTYTLGAGTSVASGDSLAVAFAYQGVSDTSDVGTYADAITVSATVTRGGTDVTAANYNVTCTSADYTVTKAAMTVTGKSYSGTYDAEAHGITVEVVPDVKPTIYYSETLSTEDAFRAAIESHSAEASTTAPTYKDAGEYTVHYYVVPSGNYEATGALGSATVSVAKAPLAIKANDATVTFGDAPVDAGATYDGFVGGEGNASGPARDGVLTGELAFAHEYARYGNVGSYAIEPSGLDAANYAISFERGTLTVGARALTQDMLTVEPTTFGYDSSAHTPGVKVVMAAGTGEGAREYELTNGVDFSLAGETTSSGFGTHFIVVNGSGNFSGTLATSWRNLGDVITIDNYDIGKGSGTLQVVTDLGGVDIEVEGLTRELLRKLMTADELAEVNDGADGFLYLQVQRVNAFAPVDEDPTASLLGELGATAALKMEITLWKQVGSHAASQITDTGGDQVGLTVSLSDDMVNKNPELARSFWGIRAHEGDASVLSGPSGDSNVILSSSLFSGFTVGYRDDAVPVAEGGQGDGALPTPTADEPAAPRPAPGAPARTGDPTTVIPVLAIAVIGAAAAVWGLRRRRDAEMEEPRDRDPHEGA